MTGESSWHGWQGENFCLSLLSGSCMIMLFRVSTLVDPYNEFAFVNFLASVVEVYLPDLIVGSAFTGGFMVG